MNQRIRLTKMMLKNSLIEIMKTKSIHKITIKEICEHASINRSTFYNHYNTEFDLLKDIEDECLATIESVIKGYDVDKIIIKLLEYVLENMETFKIFLDNSPGNHFYERLISMCLSLMSYDEKIINKDHIDDSYLHNFIVYGALSSIKIWIRKEKRETPKEMNHILMSLFGNYLQRT